MIRYFPRGIALLNLQINNGPSLMETVSNPAPMEPGYMLMKN